MKTSSFFIVAVILGIVIENIITRYLLLNLNQQKNDGNIIVKSRINEEDDYSSFPHGTTRTFRIKRHQYPDCMLENIISNHRGEFVKRVLSDGEQLVGWDVKIGRDPSNFFTCCKSVSRVRHTMLMAELECHAGAIENLVVYQHGRNCGLDKILVRLCMNADYNGQSQHALDTNENRAMEYISNRIRITTPPLNEAYDLLLRQAEETCQRILMVPMEIANGYQLEPRILFDSAKYAMYDSIAYEYTDDVNGIRIDTIDPSFEYTHFASLAAQADSFDYGTNEAEFERDERRVVRKRVVGDGARWYICMSNI